MDIADKIKFLRTNILDISQDKFAKKIAVTRATINNWLKWKVKFHFKKMKNKSRIYSFRKQIL